MKFLLEEKIFKLKKYSKIKIPVMNFIKKNIIKYLNDFKRKKNSGFLVWRI